MARRWDSLGAWMLTSQLIALVLGWLVIKQEAHLPAPFFYDAADTFMDFFHTNFWSADSERYTVWKSVYLPLSFLIGAMVTQEECRASYDAFVLRDCSLTSVWLLVSAHIINALLSAWLCLRHVPPAQRSPLRFMITMIAFLLLMPSLFALERGNYIVLSVTALLLFVADEHPVRRSVYLAVAINLKQYLALLLIPLAARRKVEQVFLTLVFAAALHLFAVAALGESMYPAFLENMQNFAQAAEFSLMEKLSYATSFSSWIKAFDRLVSINPSYAGGVWGIFENLLRLLRWVVLIIFLVGCDRLIRYRRPQDEAIFALYIILFLVVMMDSIGGYAGVLLIPFLVCVPDGQLRTFHRYSPVLLFVAMTPLDFGVGPGLERTSYSFLAGYQITYNSLLTLGSYLRPIAYLILLLLLMHSIFKDHRPTQLERAL